jgi:hypothetical protein
MSVGGGDTRTVIVSSHAPSGDHDDEVDVMRNARSRGLLWRGVASLLAVFLVIQALASCAGTAPNPSAAPSPSQPPSPSSSPSPSPIPTITPEPTPRPLTGVTAIAAGGDHACAIVQGGSVYCWGDNAYGELGNGSVVEFSVTPVKVAGLGGATAIAAGYGHTCAIISEGRVRCWGRNDRGQLGGGSPQDIDVLVPGISGVAAIAAGDWNTCALVVDGTIQCWGVYSYSDYADDVVIGTRPRKIQGISGATGIASDAGGSCAIFAAGTVECWGSSYYSTFGIEDGVFAWKPRKISGIGPAKGIDMPGLCVLLLTGGLECRDFVADTGCPDCGPAIVKVPGITDAVAISDGDPVYALLSDGTVWSWWGTGLDETATAAAEPVPEVSGATAIDGGFSICVLISDGTVRCWESDDYTESGSNSWPAAGWPHQVVAPAS